MWLGVIWSGFEYYLETIVEPETVGRYNTAVGVGKKSSIWGYESIIGE